MEFSAMSCGQLQAMKKLARDEQSHKFGLKTKRPKFLKTCAKFVKKTEMGHYQNKKIFGVPLTLIQQGTGQTLPIGIQATFIWLQLNALSKVGIFRESGVKLRTSILKDRIKQAETLSDSMDILNAHKYPNDMADMLKHYFRELPRPLLKTKISKTLKAIFERKENRKINITDIARRQRTTNDLPCDARSDAVQSAVLLLPDENREVLYILLEFLMKVANNSTVNRMSADNLALCFAPALFHGGISEASTKCLAFMISNYEDIFTASAEKMAKCKFGHEDESKRVQPQAACDEMRFEHWQRYLDESVHASTEVALKKSTGWKIVSSRDPEIETAYKKIGDGNPLPLWRCVTEIEAPPNAVVVWLKSREKWDTNMLQCDIVKELNNETEIVQYTLDVPSKPRDFCVLRAYQSAGDDVASIVEASIDYPQAEPGVGSVRGKVLASRYLIEPCCNGKSRLVHYSRVDLKGKTRDWYKRHYGYICSEHLSRMRQSIHSATDVSVITSHIKEQKIKQNWETNFVIVLYMTNFV